MRKKRYLSSFFLALCLALVESSQIWPFELGDQKSARELSEGPIVKFENEEALEQTQHLYQTLEQSDIVFEGKIETIEVTRVGVGPARVPVAKIYFDEVEVLKGKRPPQKSFQYPDLSKILQLVRGQKVVVGLEKSAPLAKDFKIATLAKATKSNIQVAKKSGKPQPKG